MDSAAANMACPSACSQLVVMLDSDPNPNSDLLPGRRQALAEAIEALYVAFGRYTLHHPVVGCPCCTSAEDDRLVRSKPLRRLTAADLERFAFNAVSTLGTVGDFKHFLPRLLELAATEGKL